VVPVNPAQRIAELSKSDLADLFDGVKLVQNTLSAYFETKDFTVVVHDGPMAGQEIPHVHVHVIPRAEGDGGQALPALFPEATPANPPDYQGLAELCAKIKEASK